MRNVLFSRFFVYMLLLIFVCVSGVSAVDFSPVNHGSRGYDVLRNLLGRTIVSNIAGDVDDGSLVSYDAPDEEWNRTFGGIDWDGGYSVLEASDGGYVIVGETESFGAGVYSDVWLIKTDADGVEEWNRTFGGGSDEVGAFVMETSDGGYLLTGYTSSFGAGNGDVWLVKVDSDGNEEWNKTFGGDGDEVGIHVVQTSDGGYLLVGYTYSFGMGNEDIWVIRTYEDGSIKWDKTFGGVDEDFGVHVLQSSDSGYVVVGWTESYGVAGSGDVWLIKLMAESEPRFEVKITGGMGVKVTVKNVGDAAAYNVSRDVRIWGGLLGMINISDSFFFEVLEPGEMVTATYLPIGLGPLHAVVNVDALNAAPVESRRDGFIILFFVMFS